MGSSAQVEGLALNRNMERSPPVTGDKVVYVSINA